MVGFIEIPQRLDVIVIRGVVRETDSRIFLEKGKNWCTCYLEMFDGKVRICVGAASLSDLFPTIDLILDLIEL